MVDLNDLLNAIIHSNIWSTPPVSEQPEITLVRWRVVEVYTLELQVERHFIGYNVEDREGRVSSAIQEFNPTISRGITRSGRVYHLEGDPGRDPDGEYVWQNWARINQFTDEKDVTVEFRQSMPSRQP